MNRPETAQLLEFCAAYDQRPVTDPAVDAWHEALDSPWVPGLSLDEAHAAVIAHYRTTPQRVTPADVLKRVKADRIGEVGGLFPMRRTGVPATEEYRKIRAETEAREHPLGWGMPKDAS